LNGVIGLALADNKTIEEMEMMANGTHMMNQPGAQKNYKALFKSEKDNYDIMNYKYGLNDVEDAFLMQFNKPVSA
jgi:hypothetical protein